MEAMKGGKIIGQGTYGCVFQGPLLCRKKQLSKSKVGKITEPEDVARELRAFSLLNPIKESRDYFLLPDSACTPRILESQIDSDLQKCEFLKKHDIRELKQLSMSYGGKDLYNHSLVGKPNIPFFVLMKHLLEAGALMLLHGFVHFDIHAGNIVIDKINIPRLIDFGQSFLVGEITLDSINDRWKVLGPEFSAEPPEITFLTSLDIHNKYTFEEAVTEVMPKKKILHTIEKLLGIPIKKQIADLVRFFKNSLAFHNNDLVKIWNLYYPGFDSWSIGVILIEYLQKILYSYEFIESSEWKLKRVIVVDILKKMLSTNPKERIDCVEALSMFDPFNDIYLQYGVEWLNTRKKQRKV